MTSSIGSIAGSVVGAAVTQAATAPVAPAANTAVSTAAAASSASQVVSPNQRIVFDPEAGLINQYLDSKGSIESQVPSTVAVAYLRAGLTAAGLPKSSLSGSVA